MKKLIYSAALFAATMIGFTSCDKDDDEKADVKNEAVGEYNVTTTFHLYDGATLRDFDDDDEAPEAGKVISTNEGLQLQVGTDAISLINITEAANGFTCSVKDVPVTETDAETGEPYTYTISGFNGYEMKYHGGYNSSTKTLEVYMVMPMDNASIGMTALLFPENEEYMKQAAPFIQADDEAGYGPIIEELGAKYKFLMKFTCVKK